MLVSIIIPIYNVEEYIEECLESVYQQTYPHIEVILVNDCTPDNSMKIAKTIINKYKDQYPTTIINHEHNKGISEARTSGMKIAKGEYIYFIDSDDAIMLDAIELLANVAIKYKGIEIVKGKYITDNKYTSNKSSRDYHLNIFHNYKCKEYFLLGETNLFVWNILFKSDFIINHSISFQSNIIYEDTLFRINASQYLSTMAVLSADTYFYRYNEVSLSHKATIQHLHSIEIILNYICKILQKESQAIPIYLSCFCRNTLLYWNKPCRKLKEHKDFFKPIYTIVKRTILQYFKYFKLVDIYLLSPFFLPYLFSQYYVKLVWIFHSSINSRKSF